LFYNPSRNFHDKCLTFLVSLSLPQVRDVHHPGINIFLFYAYCWLNTGAECFSHLLYDLKAVSES